MAAETPTVVNTWDIRRPVDITKFELLCLLRQYGLELGKPDISEQRIKDIIDRMVELRAEFANDGKQRSTTMPTAHDRVEPEPEDD